MQNIDLYEGKHLRDYPPQFDRYDKFNMEYFSKNSEIAERENERSHKRAAKIITLIGALIIISFTTGLVVGIKFGSGGERKIVDDHTLNAMNSIGERVFDTVRDIRSNSKPVNNVYPPKEYPFVIQLGKEYSETDLKSVAQFLSSKGHTVIVLKNNQNFKVFTGPYKTEADAKKSLSEISLYKQYSISTNAQIIKRT
ncbi:MAG: SPOR domain-containing protein [Leptospirales bacterium]|nr:SPOR domain-containing protein [Leptospirales bacterium]